MSVNDTKFDRQSIYQVLRNEILRGDIEPGTSLREISLAERFSVSRTPVRDALFRLEEAGLLARNARGLEVKGADPETIVQVYDMRILLEEEVSGQAAEKRSVHDILRLEALVDRDWNIAEKKNDVLRRSNLEFHEAVWTAAHNTIITELLKKLSEHLIHAPKSTLTVGARWEESLEQHQKLVQAIKNGDVETARQTARTHFEEARELRLQLLREMIADQTVDVL